MAEALESAYFSFLYENFDFKNLENYANLKTQSLSNAN